MQPFDEFSSLGVVPSTQCQEEMTNPWTQSVAALDKAFERFGHGAWLGIGWLR